MFHVDPLFSNIQNMNVLMTLQQKGHRSWWRLPRCIKSLWLNKMTCNFFDILWLWSLISLVDHLLYFLKLSPRLVVFYQGILTKSPLMFQTHPKNYSKWVAWPIEKFPEEIRRSKPWKRSGINEHTAYSKIIPKSCLYHPCMLSKKRQPTYKSYNYGILKGQITCFLFDKMLFLWNPNHSSLGGTISHLWQLRVQPWQKRWRWEISSYWNRHESPFFVVPSFEVLKWPGLGGWVYI